MSLTYRPKNKRTDDFDANVAGATYLYRLHSVLGLPVCEDPPSTRRVPYKMDAATARMCAKRINAALVVLGAFHDDQPEEIGHDDDPKTEPSATAQYAQSWAEFLQGCSGYEAV